MKTDDIKKYASLMKELELTALEIKEGESVVRLERSLPPMREHIPIPPPPPFAGATAPAATPATAQNDGCISVKSPVVGVFYAAPAEDAEPYVGIGSRIEKGQTLCIIEAMKMLNEIPADCSGVVEKICVTNGQVVEFGTELFRIRRA